jgi:hypothetical protein
MTVLSPENYSQEASNVYLGPKLDRPLSLWNPLDNLKLLYWVFFFPQALHAYLNKFATINYEAGKPLTFAGILKKDKIQANLFWQGIILIIVVPCLICVGVSLLGIPITWAGVVLGVFLGLLNGSAQDVFYGMVTSTVLGVVWGMDGFTARSLVDGAAYGMFLGISMGAKMVFGVAGSVSVVVLLGVFFGVFLGIILGLFPGMVAVVAFVIMFFRLPDYILTSFLAMPQLWKAAKYQTTLTTPPVRFISRVTPLPIPYLQTALKKQLEKNFQQGIELSNQIVTYTFQFFPVTWALNSYFAKVAPSALFLQVDSLLRVNPFNWDLLKYNSVPLKFITSNNFSMKNLRSDTPAHAICGGYWLLYNKNPQEAVEFFRVVQDLPYGKEAYYTALTLLRLSEAKTYDEICDLAQGVAWPNDLEVPRLRPEVITTLQVFRLIVEEVAKARQSDSLSIRAAALNRANGILDKLQQSLDQICPLPERNIITKVVEQWHAPLVAAGELIAPATWR